MDVPGRPFIPQTCRRRLRCHAVMHASPLRSTLPRRFAWLLWLGLLLPVAQVAAACHVLSHTADIVSGQADGKQVPHASHCDLCLAAAAIAGGAPFSMPSVFAPPVLGQALPGQGFDDVWLAPPARAYLSRAPPPASH
jgi:hypothetical protein